MTAKGARHPRTPARCTSAAEGCNHARGKTTLPDTEGTPCGMMVTSSAFSSTWFNLRPARASLNTSIFTVPADKQLALSSLCSSYYSARAMLKHSSSAAVAAKSRSGEALVSPPRPHRTSNPVHDLVSARVQVWHHQRAGLELEEYLCHPCAVANTCHKCERFGCKRRAPLEYAEVVQLMSRVAKPWQLCGMMLCCGATVHRTVDVLVCKAVRREGR